jgi:hypothetical protein
LGDDDQALRWGMARSAELVSTVVATPRSMIRRTAK